MGSVKAGYECIKAFSETDFTEDLKAIDVPVLVIHSEDDQIVPYADSAPLTVKLLKNGTLKTYKDLPHGCCQTHPEIVNADILAFLRGGAKRRRKSRRCCHARHGVNMNLRGQVRTLSPGIPELRPRILPRFVLYPPRSGRGPHAVSHARIITSWS